jgi:selenide,water dikinase
VLQRALAGIEVHSDQNVLIGYENADDAGVYLFDEENALVQSVDFFTPIVDDPHVYGAIAATNALSDIYAMGATPKLALSLVGFPSKELEENVLHEILSGGNEKMKQAGVAIVGGHSVEATELKFGYCVTGFLKPEKLYANSTAQPGDVLVLTKPLGTGIVTTGIKAGKTPPVLEKNAIEWMLKLNTPAVDFFHKHSVHAVTDVTGYGLVGHAFELARASGVTLSIHSEKVPLMAGVKELAEGGLLPKAIEANRHYVGAEVSWNTTSEFHQQVLLDPQTSGGLLVSLPEEAAESLGQSLEKEGFIGQLIGYVRPLDGSCIRIE